MSGTIHSGVVYLVGAGPGDPDLITVAGLKALRRADVVLYDRLVNPALLEHIPAHAERVFVGKTAQHHAFKQSEINTLLIEYARDGKTVVRLKGGDPFIFGRGGEEAEACALAGIEWHVIPGITSALAVPASVSIPLTHRDMASSFAVVTGHRADETAERLDWSALARIDTLVILMGVENLAQIVANLIENGKPLQTPVAIVERGTTPDEKILVGTLVSIVERAESENVSAPAVIVIGEVVHLREVLGLQEVKPIKYCI